MKKKLFFVHVPKTAGSSFNAFLADNFEGEAHCEKYIDFRTRKFREIDKLKSYDYISGHLNFSDFSINELKKDDYFIMTFLRDPLKQLISHINWVIHIFDISEQFFKSHPQVIQDMSLELRGLNLNDANQLIPALEKHSGLFQNNQTKYFRGQDNRVSAQSAINALSELDLVGITEEYERSVRTFIQMNKCEIEFSLHKKNRNLNYRLKPEVLLKDPNIDQFFREYNKEDIKLYQFARKNFLDLIEVSSEVLRR